LDIAISQFAPCSESVKDGLIHTAAGVVAYYPLGPRIMEEPNPLGPPIPIGMCRRWPAIVAQGTPASCPIGGAVAPEYSLVNLSQPRGFRTWWGTSRDFDGVFEWSPRASRPKMGITPVQPAVAANFEVASGEDTVYVINDNDGVLFDFQKLA